MEILDLDTFRHFFVGKGEYLNFVEKFTAAIKPGISPVIADGKIIGSIMSVERTKEYLVSQIQDQPELLNTLLSE